MPTSQPSRVKIGEEPKVEEHFKEAKGEETADEVLNVHEFAPIQVVENSPDSNPCNVDNCHPKKELPKEQRDGARKEIRNGEDQGQQRMIQEGNNIARQG